MRGTDTTYNHLRKHTLAAAIGALLIAAGVLWSGTLSSNASTAPTLGVDALPDGLNTGSSLGTIDPCAHVDINQNIDVDIFVADVNGLQAWELYFGFDAAKLDFVQATSHMISGIAYTALENVPGSYFLADAATQPSASTTGVLTRVTLHAKSEGFSKANIEAVPARPILSDNMGGHPGNTDNDPFGYFDPPTMNAQIAIGSASCSGAPTPSPTPVTTPSPTPTPTPSPTPTGTVGGNTSTPTPTPTFTPVPGTIPWGDINCANGVTIDDAVYIAMLKVGLAVSPIGNPCPEVGDQLIGAPIAVNWGDFDCSQQFDLGDAIHILRYLIGITGGIVGCPLIATNYVSFP